MTISEGTSRRLIAESGGVCANPACTQELFEPTDDGRVATVAERAHIIARSPKGKRGGEPVLVSERDAYENLVLLCANCHTKVDTHSDIYPSALLRRWKEEHRVRVRSGIAHPLHTLRVALANDVHARLRENRAIYKSYGPEFDSSFETPDRAARWRDESVRVILPNNMRIIGLLRRNAHLLNPQELELSERFAVHADGFAFNCVSGNKNSTVPRFPEEMNSILEEHYDA